MESRSFQFGLIGLAAVAICLLGFMAVGRVLAAELSFSRANCSNNESITWQYPVVNANRWWRVISTHRRSAIGWGSEEVHSVDSGWGLTWRSAAVHWGEGASGMYGPRRWFVVGQHYEFFPGAIGIAGARMIAYTTATNCNAGQVFPDW